MRVLVRIGASAPRSLRARGKRGGTLMKTRGPCVVAMALGVLSLGSDPIGAQAPPPATAAQNAARVPVTLSRPTGRFGRTLGLPKDGKDLYIADEDYIRFP